MGFDFIMDIPMKNMNTNHVNKEDDNSKLLHSAIILVGSTGTGKVAPSTNVLEVLPKSVMDANLLQLVVKSTGKLCKMMTQWSNSPALKGWTIR